jgi:hypothetical protein
LSGCRLGRLFRGRWRRGGFCGCLSAGLQRKIGDDKYDNDDRRDNPVSLIHHDVPHCPRSQSEDDMLGHKEKARPRFRSRVERLGIAWGSGLAAIWVSNPGGSKRFRLSQAQYPERVQIGYAAVDHALIVALRPFILARRLIVAVVAFPVGVLSEGRRAALGPA